MPKVYMIQFFRLAPGDVGIPDMPALDEELDAVEKSAGDVLLAYFNDERIPKPSRPHHSNVVGDNDAILVELMVNGHRKIQRVVRG